MAGGNRAAYEISELVAATPGTDDGSITLGKRPHDRVCARVETVPRSPLNLHNPLEGAKLMDALHNCQEPDRLASRPAEMTKPTNFP